MSRIAARDTITVDVRFFAMLRERAGGERCRVELPGGSTVAALCAHLRERLPEFPEGYAVAVGLAYAASDHILEDGDEVALIPPVSGG